MKDNLMKPLAISILNWNSIDDTKKCIETLKKSIFKDFDIYLIDN
jgi:GT2 family glycosyltransferase